MSRKEKNLQKKNIETNMNNNKRKIKSKNK